LAKVDTIVTPETCSVDVEDRVACDLAPRKGRCFRIYDLRSTYATRLSAGSVADEWVAQMLRQGDPKVFTQ
jgi:hypothetical protein